MKRVWREKEIGEVEGLDRLGTDDLGNEGRENRPTEVTDHTRSPQV
jgi:hypothetical protein